MRSAPLARLARLKRLASAAFDGDAAAIHALAVEVSDGLAVDASLDQLFGFEPGPDPIHMEGRNFARAEAGMRQKSFARSLYWKVYDIDRFVAPKARSKRGAKFFAALALAFVWIDLTGRIPEIGSAWGSDDGALSGSFVDFVTAVDAATPIAGGERGFDRAIRDALTIGQAELQRYLDGDTDWPPPFGTPAFMAFEPA